jgi:hypothetical protein
MVTVGIGEGVRTVDEISVVDVVNMVGAVDMADVVDMDMPGTVEVTELACKVIVTVVVGVKSPRAWAEVPPMLTTLVIADVFCCFSGCVIERRQEGVERDESRGFEVGGGVSFVS